jgi:UDP-N-acetyl-D-mannosaminuronic acid transferase (WecB/TagA/CpsF family)
MSVRVLRFAKINFIEAEYEYIIKLLFKKKGYLVIPAASSLVEINKNSSYKLALQKSTAVLFDSGFFCISLLFTKFIFFNKFSGFKFLKLLLKDNNLKNKKILCLDPSILSAKKNYLFLKSKKFIFIRNYICPNYKNKSIKDVKLLNIINKLKPEIIISNIGGGTQEVLAFYINKNVHKKTIIICSGAALAFLTGEQAGITDREDKYYLGWFKRLLFNPVEYSKRIYKSLPLFFLVLREKINVSYK